MSIRAPTVFLVHPDEVMDTDEILFENLTLADFGFVENLDAIHFAAIRRLLHNSMHCQCCKIFMSLVLRSQAKDGYAWACRNCYKRSSIRSGSFLSRSHLTIKQTLIIVYCWARDFPQKDMAYEAQVGDQANNTTVDWCCFLREVCEQFLIDRSTIIGGLNENGLPKIVEISDSKCFHRKYRQRSRDLKWVFRGIEKESGKCFLVEVPNRSAETLTSVIEQYVLPGSIIVSPGESHYNLINQIGGGVYEHHVKDNFDDLQVDGGQLENIWWQAKKKRCKSGYSKGLVTSYMHECMWRNQYGGHNMFGQILLSLGNQYPI